MKRYLALLAILSLLLCSMPVVAGDHAAIGAEKCAKMCHKVQFKSWSESKHAKASPATECEACHGNGADYAKLSIMKDPAKAKDAGLVAKPDMATCTTKCHKPEQIKPDMLAKVHDHKAK